jgi:hypothetical protein
VSTIEELLERKSSGSGLESRNYGGRDPSCWPCGTLYPQKFALTSLTSGGRSVGIVRSRTQATVFSLVLVILIFLLDFPQIFYMLSSSPLVLHALPILYIINSNILFASLNTYTELL